MYRIPRGASFTEKPVYFYALKGFLRILYSGTGDHPRRREGGDENPMPHEKDQSATFSFKRIETVFLVLLLVTTFCSTFCAYEANNWNSISSTKNREGTDLRTQSVRAYNDGNTRLLVDISAFTTWIDAMSLNDTRKADAVRERFTPEMKVAFSAWADARRSFNGVMAAW